MTRRTFALSLAACYPAAVRGETALERGRRMIDKAIYGLGGDAFRNMQTRTETGRAYSFYRDRLTGLSVARMYTKYLPHDSGGFIREVQRQAFGKKEDDAVIFTTKEAYEVTYRGAQPLTAERLEQFRNTTLHDIFYILRERIDEPGMQFEAHGPDVVENQPVETVEIYDSENRNVTVWLNADTFLPVKQRFRRWDPAIKDRREEVARYSKYRDIGNGFMWPYATERDRDSEKIFQFYSERVSVNDALKDSLFELPNGVKILK